MHKPLILACAVALMILLIVLWNNRLTIGATLDNAEAEYELAERYKKGHGVEQNDSEAMKWYRKAAEHGHAGAQCHLGFCYEYGVDDVEQNYSEAANWYRKAAEQGHAEAQWHLGFCYEYGGGVEKDISEAAEWYQKAADQGNSYAEEALKRLGY